MRRASLLTLVLSLGCSSTPPEADADESDSSGIPIETQGDGDGDATNSGPKFDMSDDNLDLPGGDMVGCEKIDFLFVIDSSGSMADNQANLIASFPGLVTAMMENVAANDWHVMVVDADAKWGGTDCANACMTLGACPDEPAFDCAAPPPGYCDILIGAGQTGPLGEAASNQDCQLLGGMRYIQADEPDLLSAFSCVAKVGIDGSDAEQQMAALVSALSPELNAETECNEGFVRDDAILVITIITDEPDENSVGDPSEWAAAVTAAKGGNPDAVVVLGLLPDGDLGMPVCDGMGATAPRMNEFLQQFGQSSRASVCEPDYSPFFVEAVEVISEACDNFVPIG